MDRIKPEIQNKSLNSLEICTEYNAKVGNESRQKDAVGQSEGVLSAEYGISEEQAKADVSAFLDTLRGAGCLDEE